MFPSVCLQLIGKRNYSHNNATVLGVVLNKVNPKEHSIISQQVRSKVQSPDFAFAGALPYNPLLTTVRSVLSLSPLLGQTLCWQCAWAEYARYSFQHIQG